MNRTALATAALAATLTTGLTLGITRSHAAPHSHTATAPSHSQSHTVKNEHERLGTVGPRNSADQTSPLTFQGGLVMHSASTYVIFWLPDGYTFEPNGSDSSYTSLILRYFNDVNGSSLGNLLTQYTDTTGSVQNSYSLGGSFTDTSPYPREGTQADPLLDSDIQNEIAKVIADQNLPTGVDTQYIVYTGSGVESCKADDHVSCSFNTYCGYHSSFDLGGVPVIYANMPDNGGISGCMARDGNGNLLSPNNDPAADSTINTTSHEQFEMMTDPLVNSSPAYVDANGDEIGDKCAYTFGDTNSDGANIIMNGNEYILQQEWSNADGACTLGA